MKRAVGRSRPPGIAFSSARADYILRACYTNAAPMRSSIVHSTGSEVDTVIGVESSFTGNSASLLEELTCTIIASEPMHHTLQDSTNVPTNQLTAFAPRDSTASRM